MNQNTLRLSNFLVRYVTFILFLGINIGSAQVRTEYVSPSYGVGARATALSDAYISEPYDAASMYYNPAAIRYLKKTSISLNHSQEFTHNIMNENVTLPVTSEKENSSIGVGITVNHIGYLKHSSTTDFKVLQYGLDVVYAYSLIPSLSVGTRMGTRYGKSDNSSVWTASLAVGLFYFPSSSISYGLSLSGMGSGMKYVYSGSVTSLNRINLQRSLQIGATMRYPSLHQQPKFILAIANEKIINEDGLLYKGGIEYYPIEIVALRLGYLVEPNSVSAKYGVGLKIDRFQIDWSVSPSKLSDRFYQVSVAFDLKGEGLK